MSFADHFSAVSAAYAAFRPRYPDELFAFLAREARARTAAWDAGTGSGQAALGLAQHFGHVTATDASEEQLEHATPDSRVTYRVAPAEASGLADHSIDLVTAAQAVHWFDRPRFWAEARRVLKPGGLIAVWTYVLVEIEPRIDAIVRRSYESVVGPFWPPERRLTEQRYRTIDFPFSEMNVPAFAIERQVTLEELAGYVRTWSATRGFIRAYGRDPVDELITELAPHWGAPHHTKMGRWPIAMRAGRT